MIMDKLAIATLNRTVRSTQKASASKWPPLPYKGLNFYTAEDAALFCERDKEIDDCAQIVGNFTTKMLLLHGRTGTGKSSFLRAGLFPRLMENLHFYCIRCTNNDEPVLIRSTGDPIASIMDVLHDRLRDPLAFPEVAPQARLDACGMLECLPKATGKERAESLLSALRLLTSRLPGTLVLAIDQAEEVFTLATEETSEVRSAYFDLLDDLCHDRFDIKVILALRTEYYGQFADNFRLAPDLSVSTVHSGLEQFMLHGIGSRESLETVILRPTLDVAAVPRLGAPYKQYQFRFEAGLVREIVNDVLHHCGESSTLPIVQLVCLDLYMDLRAKGESVIWRRAYAARRGVQGAIDRYFERAIADAMGKAGKVKIRHLDAWRDVLSLLVAMQEGGALTSLLLPQSHLIEEGRKFKTPEPIETTLNAMATSELRLLRKVDLRDPETGQHATHFSLGHDALAIPLHEWKKAQSDRLRIRAARHRSWAFAGCFVGVTGLLAVITGLAGYAAYSARKAAVEAVIQGVETDPSVGSRIMLLAAIEKNANWLDRKLLPMSQIDDALRATLIRGPFFSMAAACAGFSTSGYSLALAGSDDSVQSINIQALANRAASPIGPPPKTTDMQRQPCATGFVRNLTAPVLFVHDSLRYTNHDGLQLVQLKSLVNVPPDSGPRFANFGAGMFRLTTWLVNPNRSYTQTFLDFYYDADQTRFKAKFKRAPDITVPGRNGIVFSEATQFFAYTEDVEKPLKNNKGAPASANTTKGSEQNNSRRDEGGNVRVVVRSRNMPDVEEYAVNEVRADYSDPDQLLPWSISFLPSDDGSLVYRNKTGRFVFVNRGQSASEPITTSVYEIKGRPLGLRPVSAQFSWGRPLLAAVAMKDHQYRVAWMTKDGLTVFRSDSSNELIPLRNGEPLLPAFSDADSISTIRFSNDGEVLLFARHQANVVTVYAWDLNPVRQKQIQGWTSDALVSNACRVATNIGYPTLQGSDLKRLPESLRAQPCGSE